MFSRTDETSPGPEAKRNECVRLRWPNMRSVGSLMKKKIRPSQLVGGSMSGRIDTKTVMIALRQSSGTPKGVRIRR